MPPDDCRLRLLYEGPLYKAWVVKTCDRVARARIDLAGDLRGEVWLRIKKYKCDKCEKEAKMCEEFCFDGPGLDPAKRYIAKTSVYTFIDLLTEYSQKVRDKARDIGDGHVSGKSEEQKYQEQKLFVEELINTALGDKRLRRLTMLKLFYDAKNAEIADIFKVSTRQAERLWRKAKTLIAKYLERHGDRRWRTSN